MYRGGWRISTEFTSANPAGYTDSKLLVLDFAPVKAVR
jgi:hypothetical protein